MPCAPCAFINIVPNLDTFRLAVKNDCPLFDIQPHKYDLSAPMTVLISPVFEQYISCNTTATKCKRSFTGYLTFLSVATLLYIVISITTPPGASHCSRFQFHKHKPKRPIRSAHRTAFPRNAHICIHSISYAYPWRCLCFGFSQITLMLPFLLMILHFSQIGFTDDLTFMVMPPFTIIAACMQA